MKQQHSNRCDPHRLDQFLNQRLPADSLPELEAHLDVCPACRDKLDELAGGARWWNEVRHQLGSDSAVDLLRTLQPGCIWHGANVSFDFLKPSEHPTSLGRLGSYEVLEVLGYGGMGIVLKAFDPALHRPVAIKVLAAAYGANGTARKRFAREAQAAAAVVHDHIVAVHAVDAEATPPYLVMSYISGQSLQQRIDRTGPLEIKEILRIGMQTASGLAAAHAQGVIHRDIKPANIMLENGIERVRITDFGLARLVGDASVTHSGSVAGTPQYMAPEQARGETVDQRADLFSLGSTIYAMATGSAPFRGESGLAVLRQVSDLEPQPMRASNPDVPLWLEGIVRKLHAKNPAERFQSAAEVAALLEGCLAHLHQPDLHALPKQAKDLARQVTASKRTWRIRLTRNELLALGTILLGGLLLSLGPGRMERDPGTGSQPSNAVSLDEDLEAATTRMHAQVESLQRSLTPDAPGSWSEVDSEVFRLRQRTQMLERAFKSDQGEADPVDSEIQSIRRRMEALRKDFGAIPE